MFLKSSFVAFLLTSWMFPFSLRNSKVVTFCVSKESLCERNKMNNQVIYLKNSFNNLQLFDKITIRQDSSRYYYKIVTISYQSNQEIIEKQKECDNKILYLIQKKENNLNLVAEAISIGKLIEN